MDPPDLWSVAPDAGGTRLDVHLAEHYRVARNRVQIWIRAERVTVDGRRGKPGLILSGGEEIVCRPLPRVDESRVDAEAGALEVLYEDEEVVAIDKPAGLAVHPGAGRPGGTLVNRLLARYPEIASVGGSGRPGIVHRLDLDTTGVMIVARTQEAYLALSSGFAERTIDKRYLAITYGAPAAIEGRIDLPIGRHPKNRREMSVRENGRPAATRYRVVAESAGLALLDLGLDTGRTHQIRVHLKAIGHPLIGDPVYGEARWKARPPAQRLVLRDFPRPALHAWRLSFDHPSSGARITLEARIPPDLHDLWRVAVGSELPVPSG